MALWLVNQRLSFWLVNWMHQPTPPEHQLAVEGVLTGIGILHCEIHEARTKNEVELFWHFEYCPPVSLVSATWLTVWSESGVLAVGSLASFPCSYEGEKVSWYCLFLWQNNPTWRHTHYTSTHSKSSLLSNILQKIMHELAMSRLLDNCSQWRKLHQRLFQHVFLS